MIRITLLILIVLPIVWCSDGSKLVEIALTTNWNGTPWILEASEFIADEKSALFWDFIERLPLLPTQATEKTYFDFGVSTASQILSKSQQDMLKYALSIRYYSPKIEMYRKLYGSTVSQLSREEEEKVSSCVSWVSINHQVSCTVSELQGMLSRASVDTDTVLFEFDHIYPEVTTASNLPIVILYATLGVQQTHDLHTFLKAEAQAGKIRYAVRYSFPKSNSLNTPSTAPNIGGYGVELAIKSLEYKTVDDSKVEGVESRKVQIEENEEEIKGFLFGVLQKRKPHLTTQLASFKSFLLSKNEQFENLKVWDLKDIGYQAAQRIKSASNPLKLMKEFSQSFPTHAVSLSRVLVNNTLKSELQEQKVTEEGKNLLTVNGRIVDVDTLNPFSLFTILRQEAQKLETLTELHISKQDAFNLLSSPFVSQEQHTFRVPISNAVLFLNDLERGEQYAAWPHSVTEIFRRVWPGSFRYIGKNFYTVITFVNPFTSQGLEVLSQAEALLNQQVPVRFGFVFVTNTFEEQHKTRDDPSHLEINFAVKILRLFHYINGRYGQGEATAFLKSLEYLVKSRSMTDESLRVAFENALARSGRSGSDPRPNLYAVVTQDTQYDDLLHSSNNLAYSLGLRGLPIGFINGHAIEYTDTSEFFNHIVSSSFYQVGDLQNLVRNGQIRENSNIYDVLQTQPGVLIRYNPLVLESVDFITLNDLPSTIHYFMNPATKDITKSVTHLVAVDFSATWSLSLALEALNFLMQTDPLSYVRVGFLHSSHGTLVDHAILAAQSTQLASKSIHFTVQLLNYALGNGAVVTKDKIVELATGANLNMEKFSSQLEKIDELNVVIRQHKAFCNSLVKSKDISEHFIVTNGRVLDLKLDVFITDDFKFLSEFEYANRAKRVEETISTMQFENLEPEDQTSDFVSNVAMKVVAMLGMDEQNKHQKFTLPANTKISLTLPNSTATTQSESFLVTAVINPLCADTQKLAPILESLVSFFDLKLQIIFNPKVESGLPLKNFYSYVIPTKVEFDAEGKYLGPMAVFHQLPTQRLLTLNLDLPERWLVSPTVAHYDLDNIKLEDVNEESLYAQFELQHILVEGNCLDITQGGAPPRGLELVLGGGGGGGGSPTSSNKNPDTIVMSNYGYFQLKANPGVWELLLKQKSRSESLYHFVGTSSRVVLDSFDGISQRVMVEKFHDKIYEQLLTDSPGMEEHANIWQSFSGLWDKATIDAHQKKAAETINIFSLASGHLYERFLKIMILSVLKHTQSPVKFWLLANFLSPKFKDFIPLMAKEYGFEYELVTYKWPAWLHKQTEKQRIIWGYKILFLDVLFPLDLKKVIYVDADQVVRADLKDLWNMNLDGAPYAYTPFCSDNHATDGFRFWTQGFWSNHLHGQPYHISALYVVDLVQFRRLAAGDILRANYAQLSQDPNSLANLDQDLPNYLQHQVRIFSLPQEWLWCETWCSQESKSKAKTIDLCNNPLTKTPKLENAVKIIPEWTSLDSEVKSLEKKVAH